MEWMMEQIGRWDRIPVSNPVDRPNSDLLRPFAGLKLRCEVQRRLGSSSEASALLSDMLSVVVYPTPLIFITLWSRFSLAWPVDP